VSKGVHGEGFEPPRIAPTDTLADQMST